MTDDKHGTTHADGSLTIYGYFRRAYRRSAWGRALPDAGPIVFGPDLNCALFSLEFDGACIVKAAYRCTTCVTLVAFCEHLSELVIGLRVEHVLRLEAEHLLYYHQEVPVERRDRALLAMNALKIAVQHFVQRSRP
jgi:hypothetical protein